MANYNGLSRSCRDEFLYELWREISLASADILGTNWYELQRLINTIWVIKLILKLINTLFYWRKKWITNGNAASHSPGNCHPFVWMLIAMVADVTESLLEHLVCIVRDEKRSCCLFMLVVKGALHKQSSIATKPWKVARLCQNMFTVGFLAFIISCAIWDLHLSTMHFLWTHFARRHKWFYLE